jgi:hypothetical protein
MSDFTLFSLQNITHFLRCRVPRDLTTMTSLPGLPQGKPSQK